MTRLLDRMDGAGYIRRASALHDRRRVVVEPTLDGLARCAEYYEGLGERTTAMLSTFDGPQLRAILEFVTTSREGTVAEAARLREDG
ncbi:hypothetical protein [Streptomyces radicis]|uniref:hypothetical protein n=1 Tax=Streptomyces radicis TaxID=1750517 RepID=UPI0026965450|nr:hypothetical protein [Streptomyces radicis]